LNQEWIADYELYSLDLTKQSPLTPLKLTNNSAVEENLKWSSDNLLFFIVSEGSIEGAYEDSQGRLYSLNMTSERVERWANQFKGDVTNYALLQGGRSGVVILGQLSTEIQVYTQQSVSADLIKQVGWNGSYQNIVTASDGNSSTIAFIHSSFEAPQEVYFANSIDQLSTAQAVTSENQLFTERSLPKGKSYRWLNEDDRTEIEGILLYPPEKFEEKNLPLFVLIHGGPYDADLNIFRADWYNCAVMMATEGWLVFQPNYRGSTGM
jgi:dipeptidyl aminopeptidase/acylaminoacyl peptidase